MKRLILFAIFGLLINNAMAQLRVPEQVLRPVADPTMVVIDRGAKLEVLPTARALLQADAAGRVLAQQVIVSPAEDPIGPNRLGVVFNHAMQQQGFITGEIAFQMKPGHTTSEMSAALYPGLKRVTNPSVYVVNARTPAEFIAVLKRLQVRSDIEWVEPTITYFSARAGTMGNLR